MEVIRENEHILNIINDLLESGCTIPFSSFCNLVNKNYDEAIIVNFNEAPNFTFELDKCKSDNIFTFKFVKVSEEELNLTKDGFCHNKGISSLLIELQEYFIGKETKEKVADNMIQWILFLNKLDTHLYGGWLYRFFSDLNFDRDIDMITKNTNVIHDMFQLQKTIADDEIIIDNTVKDESEYINSLKILIKSQQIKFDIHRYTSKLPIDCDAFTNILMLKGKYLCVSYIPDKLSLVKTLLLAFSDIKNHSYTLVKELPTSNFNKNFRLIIKPFERLQNNIEIKYDFLDYIDVKYDTFDNIIKHKACNDCSAKNLDVPKGIPRFVVEMNDEYKCTHCIYNQYINKN